MSEQEPTDVVQDETSTEDKSEPTQTEEKTVNVNIDASKFTEGLKAELETFRKEMKTMVSEKDAEINTLKEQLQTQKEDFEKQIIEVKKTEESKKDLTKGKVANVYEQVGNALTDGKFNVGINESGKYEFYATNLATDSDLKRLSRINK